MKPKLLFIGVGAMGSRMAHNLSADFELSVSDNRPEEGRRVAASTGSTFVSADDIQWGDYPTIVLMLPNSTVVESVVTRNGAPRDIRAGATVVDMSSSTPASTRKLARLYGEVSVGYVDAPVSGGVERAESGTLSIMVGGAEPAKRAARPVLDYLGATVHDMGDSGNGHAMKCLNNLLSATSVVAACEVIAAGVRAGLDAERMVAVLNHSTGRSQATEVKIPKFVLPETYDDGFLMGLMVKDLNTAETLLGADVAAGTVRAAIQEWRRAHDMLADPAAGHTAIGRWVMPDGWTPSSRS